MSRSLTSRELVIAVATSLALHAAWLTHDAKASIRKEPPAALVELDVAPPLPAPSEPEPAAPEPAAPDAPKSTNVARTAAAAATPPAAAAAGQTLTATDSAESDVADFTLLQGSGTVYAGGTTAALGTSTKAVRGPASAGPVSKLPPGPPNPGARVATLDISRSARPIANDWNCSRLFPSDPEAGDFAVVLVAVQVSASGKPNSVAVLRDPGHGFASAARKCALEQRFEPALDRMGSTIASTTPPISVRFQRQGG